MGIDLYEGQYRNGQHRHNVYRLSRLLVLGALPLLPLFLVGQSTPAPIISEFLASNDSGLTDATGAHEDWIELFNPGSTPVTFENLYLTDDRETPDQWPLPEGRLEPGGTILYFASGNALTSPRHTNFRLSRQAGSFLALTRRTDTGFETLSLFDGYPSQVQDVSFGFAPNQDQSPVYFRTPTPDAPNESNALEGFVADTRFSLDRGFYQEPIQVTITSATPGATLVYTTDGSAPSTRHGNRVSPPNAETPPQQTVRIATTTTLRVMAFRTGWEPTNIDTQTYIFPERVLEQDSRFHAIGTAQRWGHAGPDWEMDSEITGHSDEAIRPEPTDLLRLATVSLSVDFDEVFGRNGIYIAGQNVERPSAIEFLDPSLDQNNSVQSVRSFQVDGTVQIVGGSSPNRWKSDKLSLRLKFQPDLQFAVFGNRAANRFDTLVLDARLNNVWHYGGGVEPVGQRNRAQYVRDQYAANLHNALGGNSPHGRHIHLYLNGIYWGIHTLHERPDDNFAATYLGGENEDYDAIKHRPSDVLQGSSTNYNRLLNTASQAGRDNEAYREIERLLDILDFIHYMLVNYFVGNTDWAHHNWYASYSRGTPNGQWHFHSWDAEKGLHNVTDNLTNRNDSGGPTQLFRDLIEHPEFRMQFADQAYEALRHGVLTPTTARQMYLDITQPLDQAIRIESARWGDNQRNEPFNRLDWVRTRDLITGDASNPSGPLANYFPRRSEIVLGQFAARGWLTALEPPLLSQHGGAVDPGATISIQGHENNLIYYTSDGSDPRLPGEPAIIVSTELIADGSSKRALMPEDNSLASRWFQPDFDDASWPTGRRGAGYENNNGYQSFIDPNFNFEERVNGSDNETLYLRIPFEYTSEEDYDQLTLLIRFDDGFIAYLNGTEVARANSPGQVGQPQAWNANATATHSDAEAVEYQSFDISAALPSLRNGRNVLAVHGLNRGGNSSDFLIWPKLEVGRRTGGQDASLNPTAVRYTTPIAVTQSQEIIARQWDGQQWSPRVRAQFVPQASPPNATNLRVTKIHYHPAAPTATERDAGFTRRADFEFLEITNLTDRTIPLNGLHLTQGAQFEIPSQLPAPLLAGNQSLIIAANPDAYRARYGDHPALFGPFAHGTQLSNGGEPLGLANADGEVIFNLRYDDVVPWPTLADGAGFALALRDPANTADITAPAAWMAVPQDATAATPSLTAPLSIVRLNQQWYLQFETRTGVSADQWTTESSSDLIQWTPWPGASNAEITPTDNGNQQVRIPFLPSERAQFYRILLPTDR